MLIVLTIYSTCTCVCNNAISNLATDSGTKNGMQVGFGEIDWSCESHCSWGSVFDKLIWRTIGPKSFLFCTAQFSLWASDTVNYDYIVTNSINSLIVSRCVPNGAHTNYFSANLVHAPKRIKNPVLGVYSPRNVLNLGPLRWLLGLKLRYWNEFGVEKITSPPCCNKPWKQPNRQHIVIKIYWMSCKLKVSSRWFKHYW